jgi:excisionase family DNA binding protein
VTPAEYVKMTVREAAGQLEITPSGIYALCSRGLLGHMRIGVGRGVIRIEQSDIDSFKVEARKKGEPGAVAIPFRYRHFPPPD